MNESQIRADIGRRKKDLLVDFDHTISQTRGLFDIGPPYPGTRYALETFQENGYRIVIDSCRTSVIPGKSEEDAVRQADEIRKYMKKYKLPFDEINMERGGKRYGFRIDDRAVQFKGSWRNVVRQVLDAG